MTGAAVLLMAYGTPGSPEEIEPYYTDIRRGNPPPPELLADLVRRYEAIGGTSPLAERTRDVLRRNAGRPGHIFNLGHGVLPELDPGVLKQVVDLVHEEGRTDG